MLIIKKPANHELADQWAFERYREHSLAGQYIDYLECYGTPDILLIYQRTNTELKLYRIGSHSDLF
ncbi:type II toxin-antitoxin system YafQ family toxin [Photorhabdus khanii]|uniref:type II toxin-antitoxin system RelE/ParE family toxin n=1 Tax=Photorhabdus khanii TaxID=1004150 RepID=UPI0004B12164|nr:type II toxin-antitoxin system mRNA interferase toxin, RelE/StbE family [Photorhabdus khanii]